LFGFVDGCLETASLLQDLLSAVLIVPKIGFANLFFGFLKV
jgi:hypothetical protein